MGAALDDFDRAHAVAVLGDQGSVVTGALMARYGVTSRFELGVRVPVVQRADTRVLAPIPGSTNNDAAATRDGSTRGNGVGDVELSLRYQLTDAEAGRPFLMMT